MKKLIDEYQQLKNALVSDDFEASKTHYKQVNALLSEMALASFQNIENFNSIDDLREEFIALSEQMISAVEKSNPMDETIYIQRCPMADSGEGENLINIFEVVKLFRSNQKPLLWCFYVEMR